MKTHVLLLFSALIETIKKKFFSLFSDARLLLLRISGIICDREREVREMKQLAIALLAGLGCLVSAKTINNNSTAELGVRNGPAPGVKFEHIRISNEEVNANPGRVYYPLTVEGGNPGRCIMLPGYRGLRGYRCSLEDFYLREGGEASALPDRLPGQHRRRPRLLLPDAQRILLPADGEVAAFFQAFQNQGIHQFLQHLGHAGCRAEDQYPLSG